MCTMDRLLDPDTQSGAPIRGLARGFGSLALALAPSLLAILFHSGFTTQDGPAHVYSARILNASLTGNSPFAATFRVAWNPLPNWAGHLSTMIAVAIWSPEVANRVVAAATLVVLGSAVVWLRWVVVGRAGIEVAAVLAALLALNVTWLLGFTSFLLGASVAAVTLAFWWSGRERFRGGRSVGVGGLLTVGYFCHPVSLGLTLGGLAALVIFTPGTDRLVRAGWTGLSAVALGPLAATYWAMTRSGGGLEPAWNHWSLSVAGIASQFGWVDPLSLAAKTATPFQFRLGMLPVPALAPAVWVAVGLVALIALTWSRRNRDRLGWLVMAGGGIVCGLVAPDTLGVRHGHFLPQRIVLLGLVALVPWLNLSWSRIGVRLAAGILGGALIIQSAFVWEYARTCHEQVTPFLRVTARFEPGTRSGTLLNGIRGRFRANPLLHADGLLAAATDSIFWTNYETAQYYFPVKVRADVAHPLATRFEQVAVLDEPRDTARRGELWRTLLRDHAAQLDQIVEWQGDPDLDASTDRQYHVTCQEGPIRVWSRLGRTRPRD